MKQIFAILLFAVHLFNLAGYTLLFYYLQQKNTTQTLRHIENGSYSEENLVLVKIPVLLPYASDWKDYEPYSGEIEWGGVHYNYVKRKIFNDTLYLLCLPDIKRTRLADAHERYTREVNDYADSSQKNKDSSSKTGVIKGEYLKAQQEFVLPKAEVAPANEYMEISVSLLPIHAHCIIQPPDATIV